MLWYIGNTSVRSAFRLREGLVALASSSLPGHMRGQDGDRALRQLLGERGIVSLGTDNSNSVGRKWRSALEKLGFLYPLVSKSAAIEPEKIGALDTITPSGQRLIDANTVPAMQECFLRAMAAQYLDVKNSTGEKRLFSPLQHTLKILCAIEAQGGQAFINFIEMALYVQQTSSCDDISAIARQIIAFRDERNAVTTKRRFDSQKYISAAGSNKTAKQITTRIQTFRDYADANIRYLKATGLLQSKGRGITFVPEKRFLAEFMAKEITIPPTEQERYLNLCNGAALPTDKKEVAQEALQDLVKQVAQMNLTADISKRPQETPADINLIRYDLEDIIFKQKEEQYAAKQATQWEEIATYMDLITSKKHRCSIDEETAISIPEREAPAYLEWIFWRAFLAINSLVNKPYEARRFHIDQDFLPVGTAPGNGPDLIMEFENFIIVIEVTLMENSRQEAAEGEPVRRHVADILMKHQEQSKKAVYGLFIAQTIDSNTAETFRIGAWYTKTDERLRLQIIPMTITQFGSFFRALFSANRATPNEVICLMNQCEKLRHNHEAPSWKKKIHETIQDTIAKLENKAIS